MAAQEVGHPDLQVLLDYWRGKCRGRRMPTRAEVDPMDLPGRLWAHLMLLEFAAEGSRFRIRLRLVGTHIERAIGGNPTGAFIDELPDFNPAYRGYLEALYRDLVATGAALYSENIFHLGGEAAPMVTRRLSLPLGDDGEHATMALVGAVFDYPPRSDPRYGSNLAAFTEILRRPL